MDKNDKKKDDKLTKKKKADKNNPKLKPPYIAGISTPDSSSNGSKPKKTYNWFLQKAFSHTLGERFYCVSNCIKITLSTVNIRCYLVMKLSSSASHKTPWINMI